LLGVGQGFGLAEEFLGEQSGTTNVTLEPGSDPPDNGGTSQPFDNHQPSLGITYEIALVGVYPSQNGGGDRIDLLGSIMAFAGNFNAGGYVACAGQLLSISQNTALFSILGTQYGGNGSTTFALPDLRGARHRRGVAGTAGRDAGLGKRTSPCPTRKRRMASATPCRRSTTGSLAWRWST
jgi:microcystin-dependent protein